MRRALTIPRAQHFELLQRIPLHEKLKFFNQIGYKPHVNQTVIHASQKRFRLPCCGRRFGKTFLGNPEALLVGVLGGWTLIGAPTYKIAGVDFRICKSYIDNPKTGLASIVLDVKEAMGDQEILFASGGRIYVRSTENPSSILGEGNDFALFDEAAEESDPNVWMEYIRPTLLDRGGSAMFPSTPEGDDWYKDMWEKGQNPNSKSYESWQFTSYDNPDLDYELLEEELEDMTPDIFNQEIMASFLESVGAVFKGWAKVADVEPLEEPAPNGMYVAGVDLGRYKDFTVITVMDAMTAIPVYVERFNKLDWPIQEDRIRQVLWRWQAPALIDATAQGGDRILSALNEKIDFVPIEGYIFTNQSKWALINQYAIAIQNQETRLFHKDVMAEDGTLIGKLVASEIGSMRYDRTISGVLKAGAPPGKHDDIPMSHMLCYEMARRYAGVGPRASNRLREPGDAPVSISRKRSAGDEPDVRPGRARKRVTSIRNRRY